MALLPSILRVRDFRNVWLANLASNAGSWLQLVAAGWLVFDLTGSAAAVGALALVGRIASIGLSTVAGHLADRYDRRVVGIVTSLGQAIAAGGLAVATTVGWGLLTFVYVFTFLVGVGFALGLPATLAIIGDIPGRDRLPEAVRLNAAGINVARLVGPVVGGGVLALAGPTACFAVNAVSFLGLVWALGRLPGRQGRGREPAGSMRDALRHARHDRAARRLLVGAAVFCFFASPMQELVPVVAERVGGGKTGLGILLGMMGGGAILGAWLLARLEAGGLRRHRAIPIGIAATGAGIAVIAAAPWMWLAMIGMAMGGAFWIWMFTLTNTAVQLTSPPDLLGRMLGLYQLSVIGPIALGSFAAGGVAQGLGIGPSLALCAALLAAYGGWALAKPVPEIDRTSGTLLVRPVRG